MPRRARPRYCEGAPERDPCVDIRYRQDVASPHGARSARGAFPALDSPGSTRVDRGVGMTARNQGRRRGLSLGGAMLVLAALGLIQESPYVGLRLFPEGSSVDGVLPHLRALAAGPRDAGGPGHDAARDYLLVQLRAMGLAPEVQRASVFSAESRTVALVQNVTARLAGTARSRALLVVAHYDSVAAGPGAGDDAAAVAAMLDTIHVVTSGRRPRNDVVFLFADGEELGLLGSRAFVERHRWMKDVGLVLNFDSGGTAGPTALWETSRGNAWMVREYADAVPFAVAGSWAARLSYGTDFGSFRRAGAPGLSFGFLGEQFTHYHRATDSIDRLDLNALRHTRQTMLGLVRRFAEVPLPLPSERSPDAIYFTLLGQVVAYSHALAWLFLAAASGLFAVATIGPLRRGEVSVAAVVKALFTLVAGALVASALVLGLWLGVRALHPVYYANFPGEGWNAVWYRVAFGLAGAAVSLASFSFARRRFGASPTLLAAAGLWLALSWPATVFLPGASDLVTLPALGAAAGALAAGRADGWSRSSLLLAASAPALLLFLPFLGTLSVAAGLSGAFVVVGLGVLLLAALAPQLLELFPSGAGRAGIAAALVAAVALGGGSATSRFTEREPDCGAIDYVWDQDREEAVWRTQLAPSARAPWLAKLFAGSALEAVPKRLPTWNAPAPPLPGPRIRVRTVADRVEPRSGERSLTLVIEGLAYGHGRLTFDGVERGSIVLKGFQVPLTMTDATVTAFGPPNEPLEVTVLTARPGAFSMRVESMLPLRALRGVAPPERPSSALPSGDRATLTCLARFPARPTA